MPIESTQTVDDVMRRWPAAIRVFLDHRMRCIGCPIAAFHTVDDACHEHQVDRARVLADLNAVAARAATAGLGSAMTDPASVTARWPTP
jgi:hybrid cluster-associated redox disulfide protein